MTVYTHIYDLVRQIPHGQVATYGQIAELAGLPGRARLVGYALYQVDMVTSDIPWHRVVNALGKVSLSPLRRGSDYWQRSLLEQEGIAFEQDRIDLGRYRWRPNSSSSLVFPSQPDASVAHYPPASD